MILHVTVNGVTNKTSKIGNEVVLGPSCCTTRLLACLVGLLSAESMKSSHKNTAPIEKEGCDVVVCIF